MNASMVKPTIVCLSAMPSRYPGVYFRAERQALPGWSRPGCYSSLRASPASEASIIFLSLMVLTMGREVVP